MDFKTSLILCISSIFCTAAFCFVFRMKKANIPLATLSGLITCIIYVVCCRLFSHEFFQNFFPACFAAAFAEVLARITKSTASAYSACAIVILIPGAKLYYTMYYITVGQMDFFRETVVELLRISSGIAVGIVLVTVIVREVNRRKFEITNK